MDRIRELLAKINELTADEMADTLRVIDQRAAAA